MSRISRLMMPNGSRSPSPLQRAKQRKVTHRKQENSRRNKQQDNNQRKTSTGILGWLVIRQLLDFWINA